jgi:dihydropteroate synthase
MAARSPRRRASAEPLHSVAAASGGIARGDATGSSSGDALIARAGRGRTLVMGVLNVTPDSFHAASRAPDPAAALVAARRLIDAGADVLDVGGESTRPGATPVAPDVELARVLPVIEALHADGCPVPISIDTYKAAVARAAVTAGASVINDVAGGLLDGDMARTAAVLAVPIVVGHLRGTPESMARHAAYADLVADVRTELAARVAAFVAAGVARERILIDPGIGFAKGAHDNLELLRRLGELRELGCPLVVGVSRKRFVGEALRAAGIAADATTEGRLEGSLAAAVLAVTRGAAMIRTHDVAETRRALAIADAILHEA